MHLGDRWVVALAAATAAGAWAGIELGRPVAIPLWLAVSGVATAFALRRPAVLCLVAALLALLLAQRSLAGLVPPAQGDIAEEVTLVGDPTPLRSAGVRVDVRLHGKRLAATAWASAATALRNRLAGERVLVVGEVSPPGPYEEHMPHRHLAGRLRIDAVVGWRPGHGVTRLANGLRRTLEAGARSLPDRQRSLLAGLVLGDDRWQPDELKEAFRQAGLSHLTAVSGQNVAFVIVLAAPLLRRIRFAPRLVVTMLLLAGFALVTRGEPSVLRATAMAAIAALGSATGRPVGSLRALALAVTGLLLVDPLLVSSLGFRLSVAATAGIVLGAGPLQRRLPGPRWLAMPLAITLAAQGAVAPLLILTFGPISLASIPANLLAVPAAGPVMVWGLTGGFVAGLAGPPVADLLHWPSRLMLAWIEGVARHAAAWPLGSIDMKGLAALVLATALTTTLRRRRRMSQGVGTVGA